LEVKETTILNDIDQFMTKTVQF